jgi:hypothetical protein
MIGSNILNGVRSALTTNQPHAQSVRNLAQATLQQLPPAELYAVLRALYNANGLFDELRALNFNRDGWAPALKGIYNPTNRAVEFFANRTLRGDLEIVTENERIKEPIAQVFKWSNMANLKTVISRVCARDGDAFIQVVRPADRDRVYFQLLDAAHVIDFDDDARGNITWLRLEKTSADRDDNGELHNYQHIEVWSKPAGLYRRWRIDQRNGLGAVNRPLNELGQPAEEITFEQMGIDWVPIVHGKHRDVDEPRGVAAVLPAYDMILEACLMATRLHQLLYRHNNVTQAIQSAGRDPSGRPIPPPAVSGVTDDDGTVTLGDDKLLRLPAGWELSQLVPQLPYADALAILTDQMARIEDTLPVLVAFKRLREMGEVSGRAARLLLGDAAEQVEEAGGNLEAVVIRADQMALTIGQGARLRGFESIGTFDAGDFEHTFAPREIFPSSDLEDATAEQARAAAVKGWVDAGLPLGAALVRAGGYTETEAAELVVQQADAVERGAEGEQ